MERHDSFQFETTRPTSPSAPLTDQRSRDATTDDVLSPSCAVQHEATAVLLKFVDEPQDVIPRMLHPDPPVPHLEQLAYGIAGDAPESSDNIEVIDGSEPTTPVNQGIVHVMPTTPLVEVLDEPIDHSELDGFILPPHFKATFTAYGMCTVHENFDSIDGNNNHVPAVHVGQGKEVLSSSSDARLCMRVQRLFRAVQVCSAAILVGTPRFKKVWITPGAISAAALLPPVAATVAAVEVAFFAIFDEDSPQVSDAPPMTPC
eukprot:IDg12292t1